MGYDDDDTEHPQEESPEEREETLDDLERWLKDQ